MPGMQAFAFISRMGRGRKMKRILMATVFILFLSGCGNSKTFEEWESECSKDWKNVFGESDETCSRKEVQEYIKRSGGTVK